MGRKMFSGGAGPWESRSERRRLVGRRAALPRAGLRPHPSRARAARQAGRHDLHTSSPAASSPRSSRRARRRATRTSRSPAAASVAQQYLAAGLLDEFQIHVVPVFLGGGVRLFDGIRARPGRAGSGEGGRRRPPSPISASVSTARRLRRLGQLDVGLRRPSTRARRAGSCRSRRCRARPRSPARTAPAGTRRAPPAASRRRPCWR